MFGQNNLSGGFKVGKILASILITTFLMSSFFVVNIAEVKADIIPTIRSTTEGGDWSNPNTWVGGIQIPVPEDIVEINGIVLFDGNLSVSGLIVSSGATLQNKKNNYGTLTISGDVVNNGTITNGNNFLYLDLFGNITNNGVWDNNRTTLSGTNTREINGSKSIGSYLVSLNGDFEVLGNPVFSSKDVQGSLAFFRFNNHSLEINTPNTITFQSVYGPGTLNGTGLAKFDGVVENGLVADLPEIRFEDRAYLKGNINAHKIIFGQGIQTFNQSNISAEEIIFEGVGTKNIVCSFYSPTFNGPTTIGQEVILRSMGTSYYCPLTFNGDVVNNGVIEDGNSMVSVFVSGNITNNGTWDASQTSLTWPRVTNAVNYEFNISNTFNVWPDSIFVKYNSYNVTDLINGRYYWRVRANVNGSPTEWSDTHTINAVLEYDPIILIPGIMGSYKTHGVWTVDPILGTYDSLWQALKNQGYIEGITLFAFPYNWRDYNSNHIDDLKEKIQEVKTVSGKSKVDLVVHSMGGLVARAYIQSSDYATDDVDQLIFLGTPHLGSPEAYIQYEAVAGFKDWEGYIAKKYFQFEALTHLYTDLTKYVQERVPALKELLPIYDYLKKKVNDVWEFRTYPTENYVQNTFLENLNVEPAIDLLKSRVQITNVVSDYTPEGTLVAIHTVLDPDPSDSKWIHGYPENYDDETTDRGLERGVGDHTVPMSSATGIPGVETIFCEGGPIHRDMPTECQRHVIQALKGIWPDEIYRATLIEKLLLIYVHSPVEFQVVDEDGNVTGYDFEGDSYLENISNSLFDEEYGFVFIRNPVDGEYKINLLGIESGGDYELVINNIDETGGQESSVSGTINPGETQSYSFDYDSESTEPVVIEPEEEEISFQSVQDKVIEFYEQGLITKKFVKDNLVRTLKNLEKQYNQLDKLKKQWQKEVWKGVIVIRLEVLQKQLEHWYKKEWIQNPAYDILIKDLNSLIQMIKDLD